MYNAAAFGVAKGMAVLGAMSIDATHARSQASHRMNSGQSVRLTYGKAIGALGTEFRTTAYRNLTRGYHTFQEIVSARDTESPSLSSRADRDRLQGTATQNPWTGGFNVRNDYPAAPLEWCRR